MNDMISKSKVLKWFEIQIADCSRELKRELFAEDLVTVSERLDTLKKVYDNIKQMTPLQLSDCTDKAEGYTKKEIETASKNNCLTIRLNLAYAEIESLRKQYNEALKAQSKQKWISCDEKLPVKWENVLIFTEEEEITEAFIDREKHFQNDDCCYQHGEVKYWMPLPEPPEREEKLAEKLCKKKR